MIGQYNFVLFFYIVIVAIIAAAVFVAFVLSAAVVICQSSLLSISFRACEKKCVVTYS